MKKLTKREKVLLAVLLVIIVVVAWYKLVYEPINGKIEKFNQDLKSEQTELTVLTPKIKLKKEMQEAVEKIKADPSAEKIPAYDNSKELMVALNKIMSTAKSYSIDFGEADRDDYIFIHKILLTYTTDTYKQARKIIDRLATETFVNQISDVRFTDASKTVNIKNAKGETVSKLDEETKVTLTITFFEVAG